MIALKAHIVGMLSIAGRSLRRLFKLALILLAITFLYDIFMPHYVSRPAQIPAAKAQLSTFAAALRNYESGMGRYPTTGEGLELLCQIPENPQQNWNGPYLKTPVPLDPWGSSYLYTCPGTHNPKTYDLLSAGPDGKLNTEDDIANYPTGNN